MSNYFKRCFNAYLISIQWFLFIIFLSVFKGTTIGYVAPEILKGGVKLTKTCDIYAMGISMYEILSNKSNPWDEFNVPLELLKIRVESGERPYLQSLEPLYEDLDSLKDVSNVIGECWQNNDRPNAFQVKKVFMLMKTFFQIFSPF